MLLSTLSLERFLRLLDDVQNGVKLRRRKKRTARIAYADDVTLILTDHQNIRKVHEAIRLYAEAS